ncbi:MAG: hypothetical protein E5W30_12280, partial [Mesorhizobium sp.]
MTQRLLRPPAAMMHQASQTRVIPGPLIRRDGSVSAARLQTGAIMDARPNSPEARDIRYHLHAYTNARKHQ